MRNCLKKASCTQTHDTLLLLVAITSAKEAKKEAKKVCFHTENKEIHTENKEIHTENKLIHRKQSDSHRKQSDSQKTK